MGLTLINRLTGDFHERVESAHRRDVEVVRLALAAHMRPFCRILMTEFDVERGKWIARIGLNEEVIAIESHEYIGEPDEVIGARLGDALLVVLMGRGSV